MKKYFLMVVMMFTMSVYSFAENSTATEIEKFEKYDFKVNSRKLASFLDLTKDQMEAVEWVSEELSRDMEFASQEVENDVRERIINNVIKKNVRNMHSILDTKQYKKYLIVFNATLNNKGFNYKSE